MNERFEELGSEVARLQDEALADDRRREAVSRRLQTGPVPPKPRSSAWRPVTVLAAAGAAALVLWSFWPSAPQPIAYRVAEGGESRQVDRLIAVPTDQTVPVRFTDGASIRLEPGTLARVADLTPEGATLRIHEGEATVFVRHRETTRWSVWAGPFLVRVTGTRFRVGWRPDERSFELEVHEGEVRVRGPDTPERAVRGGEQMRVAPRPRAMEPPAPAANEPPPRRATLAAQEPPTPIREGGAPAGRSPAPALELDLPPKQPSTAPEGAAAPLPPDPTTSDDQERVASPERAEPVPPSPEPWEALFDGGDYEAALVELTPKELDQAIWAADSRDLMELSAAARRIGDRRAGSIYAVIRSRFPGTDAAADAAFMLARMEFHGGAPQNAATWLETYLRERPDGRFAREAAGRAIEAYQQTEDETRARAAAERYLGRYPKGPHAALARSVLE